MKKFYQDIISNYKNKTLDAILILGDLLFYTSTYLETKYLECLKNDSKSLSQALSVPICVSYGNHDFPLKEDDSNMQLDLAMNLDNRQEGIYVLNNEQISFDNLCVTGFSPTRDAYSTFNMPNPALDMAYENYQKCNFTFSMENINILMSHENKFFTYPSIAQQYGSELYKYLTLIIGGHLHDGYVPLWFQKIFYNTVKDYGIWEKIPPKIDMCRGAFKVNSSYTSSVILPNSEVDLDSNEALSVVLRGVAKYSWMIPATPSYTKIEIASLSKRKMIH